MTTVDQFSSARSSAHGKREWENLLAAFLLAVLYRLSAVHVRAEPLVE